MPIDATDVYNAIESQVIPALQQIEAQKQSGAAPDLTSIQTQLTALQNTVNAIALHLNQSAPITAPGKSPLEGMFGHSPDDSGATGTPTGGVNPISDTNPPGGAV